MSEQKSDRRVERTKDAIRAVSKDMVCELPYEKITVKEIAERAGINRNTFYLHYDSPDDVLHEIQTEHSDRYSALIAGYDYKNDGAKQEKKGEYLADMDLLIAFFSLSPSAQASHRTSWRNSLKTFPLPL